MNPEEVLFDKIEAYLRGQLEPDEAAAFAAEIAADPALQALVEQQRLELQGLELLVERELRAKMNAWERSAPPALVPVSGGRRVPAAWVRWAAAAVLLLGVTWWVFQRPDPAEPPLAVQTDTPSTTPKTNTPKPKPSIRQQPTRRLPNEPATPDRGVATTPSPNTAAPTPRPSTPAVPPPPDYAALASEYYRERDFIPPTSTKSGQGASYDRALRNFNDGRYTDVVPQLRPGGKLPANDLKTKELLAHAWLKNRQYDAAIATFQEIIDTHKSPYAERAQWALVLASLRQMPQRKALMDRTLNAIVANRNHPFYSKAKDLQARLNKR